jgi:protein SCO1/2
MTRLFIFITSLFFSLTLTHCVPAEDQIELAKVPQGGNFTLDTEAGKLSLSDLKGKVVFIYFGFMSCPDVCPTTLNVFSSAFKTLSVKEQSKVSFLFIDVDPERDTLDRLTIYTKYFHPQIIAMTGSILQLNEVAMLYGASFQKVNLESSMGYTMDHTSSVFVIDQNGKWVSTLPHGSKKNDIQKTIKELIKN